MAFGDVVQIVSTGLLDDSAVSYSAATAGNLLLLVVRRNGNNVVLDSASNNSGTASWALAVENTTNQSGYPLIWYCIADGGETATTVMVTYPYGTRGVAGYLIEVEGPFNTTQPDASATPSTNVGSGTPIGGGVSITPTASSDCFFVAMYSLVGAGFTADTVSSGWTEIEPGASGTSATATFTSISGSVASPQWAASPGYTGRYGVMAAFIKGGSPPPSATIARGIRISL